MKIDQGKCECVGWSPVKLDHFSLKKNKGFGHIGFFVLVKGDWQKESQFFQTIQDFWFWLKGIGKKNLSLAQPHTEL